MSATIIHSGMPGAPEMRTDIAYPIYHVLKWALPQLGWELMFDEPAIGGIVFRNASGKYLKMQHPGSANNQRYGVRCQLFDTMTDYNTGTGATPVSISDNPVCALVLGQSTGASANVVPYRFIGNAHAFYACGGGSSAILNTTQSERCPLLYFFGDLQPLDGIPAAFVMCTGQAYSTSAFGGQQWANTAVVQANQVAFRAITDHAGVFNASGTVWFSVSQAVSSTQTSGSGTPFPNVYTGGITFSPVYFATRAESGPSSNAVLRGRLPGLYACGEDIRSTFAAWEPIGPVETDYGLSTLYPVVASLGATVVVGEPPAPIGSTSGSVFLLDIINGWDY